MIFNKNNKVALLLPPKTGSRSLIEIAKKDTMCANIVCIDENHIRYKDIATIIPDVDSYTLYSFYRCPVERFLSNYAFSLHIWEITAKSIPFCDSKIPTIQNISISDYLDIIESTEDFSLVDLITVDLAAPQVDWLDGTDITLLDFRNFRQEVLNISSALFDEELVEIPHINNSGSEEYSSQLSEDILSRIKRLYARDYEFFGSQGITFDI